jgi:hypothetical protein
MNLNAVLVKTAKGQEEIDTRKHKLDMRMRALLIMVNGKATAGELQLKFGQMDDITARLDKLIADGFVAPASGSAAAAGAGVPAGTAALGAAASPKNFEAARAQLSRMLSDALGPPAESICIKIEECDSSQELKDFLDTRREMLDSALGRKGAPFWAKAKDLLG